MKKSVLPVLVLLLIVFLATGAQGKLEKAERIKVGKMLLAALDTTGDDASRATGLRDVGAFFEGKKSVLLSEVEDIASLLATSAARPKQDTGIRKKDLDLGDGVKIQCHVSVPKKYSGIDTADPWPLIVCLPDKGQKVDEYLDKYWPGDAIREAAIIAVLDIKYNDREVEESRQVEDSDGKIRTEKVKVKVPFTWDSDAAVMRFWGCMYLLQMREYKIDPNRIILDGVGFGSSGALSFASCSAWRFAGLILRGGALAGAELENLAALKILQRPFEIADEAAKKAAEESAARLKTCAAAGFADGLAMDDAAVAAWTLGARRARYPLPHKWTQTSRAQEIGYWFFYRAGNPDEPAVVTLKAEKEKKRIDLECANVAEITLYLNDVLIDLGAPFDVYINGEAFLKQVERKRSAAQMIAHASEKSAPSDPGAVFVAELTLKPPAPKAPEKKPEDQPKEPEKAPGEGGEPGKEAPK